MKRKTQVSIIVPAFNEQKTVFEILSKIARQKIKCEIIIVDDGSTDGTYKEIIKWKEKQKSFKIKIIRHKKMLAKEPQSQTV